MTRKNRRRRAIGKMIMEIKKEIMEKGTKGESVKEEIMIRRIRNKKKK